MEDPSSISMVWDKIPRPFLSQFVLLSSKTDQHERVFENREPANWAFASPEEENKLMLISFVERRALHPTNLSYLP